MFEDGDVVIVFYAQDENWGIGVVHRQEDNMVHFYEDGGPVSAPTTICHPINSIDESLLDKYSELMLQMDEVNADIIAQLKQLNTS